MFCDILARSRAWQFQVAVSLNIWCIPLISENVGQIGCTGKTYMMTDFFVKQTTFYTSATWPYAELQQNTANELHVLYTMIQVGWPETKQQVPHSMQQYWDTCHELPFLYGVIYRSMRIIIPPSMRPAMLAVIHGTHLGIVKCKQRAREVLYWPGMSAQLEEKVQDCTICHDYAPASLTSRGQWLHQTYSPLRVNSS